MTSLRELFVKVDIQDGATSELNRINGLVDDVTRGFQRLGSNTDTSFDGFRSVNREVTRLSGNIDDSAQGMQQFTRRLNVSENEMQGLRSESERFERELRDARNEVTEMAQRLNRAESEASQLRSEMHRVNQSAQHTNTSMVGLGSTLRGMVGLVGSVFAVHQLKDFAVSGIELAASTQALNSQFSQVFGEMSGTAETNLNKIAEQTSILPDRLKGSFAQMAAFAKTTGADTADALSLAERATMAAADGAAFYDKSITDVTENLQSFLKGNFENDAALGISATEFTRNAAAADLFGKKFKDLNEQQKQLTLLQMVEDGNKLSGALGQAAREGDGFENVTGNLKSSWDALKGTMMSSMLPTVIEGLQGLTQKISSVDAAALGEKFKTSFNQIKDVAVPTFEAIKTGLGWVKDNGSKIISVTAGIATGFAAFKVITTLSAGIGALSAALAVYRTAGIAAAAAQIGLNTAMLANPITWMAVGIGALVAAGIYLYRNWDTVKEKAGILKDNLASAWQQIKDNTSNAIQPVIGFFGNLKDGIVNTWTGIKDGVGSAVSQVAGFFTGLKEKAFGLWETIKQNPMLLSVVGPIGMVVGAGMTLYQNWETIRTKAGELWTTVTEKFAGIKQAVSNFIQPALGWFDSLMGKWNDFKSAISNFSMPEWMSSAAGAIGGAVKKVGNFFDGSHATGLANVPTDGYRAELHKGESVLTATQSDSLRSTGVLSANSDGTPNLDFSSIAPEQSMVQQVTNDVAPTLNQTLIKESPPIRPSFAPTFNPTFEQPAIHIPNQQQTPVVQETHTQQPNQSISVTVPVTINATAEKAQALRGRLSELEPIIRQVVSNMLDDEWQTT